MNTLVTILFRRVFFLSCLGLFSVWPTAWAQIELYPADSFVESIGVNVHWGYTDRVYYSAFPELKVRLEELGVRHLRDGTTVNEKPTVVKRINELYDDLRIRTTFITGQRENGYPTPLDVSQISDELQALKQLYPLDLVAAIEGPNEYDADNNHKGDPDWVSKVRKYQQTLYEQANADPGLRDIPIIGPSFITEQAYKKVGSLDPYIDFACLHAYQSWRNPGSRGWGNNGYGSLSWQFNYLAARQSPSGKPIQSTECGYNNYLPAERGVTEQVQGKYITRMFAEFFRRGIVRSFSYELIDQGTLQSENGERVFGILRNDRSRKPAFYAVKEMIKLLSDPGEAFEPTPLTYQLSGSTDNVRQLLLQKRDGTYYLLLWLEVESWDGAQDVERSFDPQSVTVQLPSSIKQAQLYRQGLDGKMDDKALTIENKAVKLSVYDRMQVLELSGATIVEDNAPVAGQWYFLENRFCEKDKLRLETDGCTVGGIIPGQAEDKHWQFVEVSPGYYALRNRQCPDRWLETDGEKVGLRTGGTAEDVQWKLVKAEGEYFFLQNRANDRRLDSDECSTVDANTGEALDKQWRLIPVNATNARSVVAADKALNPISETTTELTLYPNPANNHFTVNVTSPEAQTVEVSILYLSGQIVQQQSVQMKAGYNPVEMDASMLSPGVYLLQVQAPYGYYETQKLVIE